MSLISWLPLAASTLFSEKVPTLSEPLMIKIPAGTSLAVSNDSVDIGSKGLAQGYYRAGRTIKLQREKRSDTLGLTTPNMTSEGVFSSRDTLLRNVVSLDYSNGPFYCFYTIRAPYVDLGEGYPSAFDFQTGFEDWLNSSSSKSVTTNLVCAEKAIHWLNNANGIRSSVTWPARGQGHPLCNAKTWYSSESGKLPNGNSFDRSLYFARMVLQTPLGNGYWAIWSDTGLVTSSPKVYDSLKVANLDWMLVADTSGRWLSFDQSQAKLYWRSGNPRGRFEVDSLQIPGLTTEKRPCYQATRSDSLVIFAVDSQIVFVKWTPNEVRVLAKYAIPGKVIQAAAANKYNLRSTSIWATTGTELYSFKFSMEDPPVSSVSPKPSRSSLFTLQPREGGATFSWYGSGTEIVRMTGIDGRAQGAVELRPGSTTNWTAPHPGLFLAHTPDGVKRVLAR